MYRRSTNNPWIPPNGLNGGPAFDAIGGLDPSPGAGSRFAGQLGCTIVHDNASALKDSKTTVGTLFMGVYQLVKFTTAITRGSILQWDTLANNGLNDFEVTQTSTATTAFRAGVALFTDAAATGKFGYIQVAGLAGMLYRAAVTSAVIGNLVVQTSLTTSDVDAIADAGTTFATNTGAKTVIGIAYETPANSSVLRVLMNPYGFYPNIGRG